MNEWDYEPNKAEWDHDGVPCLILRTESLGHLCGYVAVPEGHPWFEKDYMEIERDYDVDVHGGLTFSEHGDPNYDKATHDGNGKRLWWIGFDCAHYTDLVPHNRHFGGGEVYRNLLYVTRQTNELAAQAIEVAETIDVGRKLP